jgi:GNAT superfamily N-acetyltransferase
MSVDIRHEPPDGTAARALFDEYLALVGERIPGFVPSEQIFGSPEVFEGPDAAWLVLYEDGEAAGCGGLRPLEPGVGEIKRMFVRAGARRRGHGRRLLEALESTARAAGHRRIVLYTTAVLVEARALYESAGYRLAPERPRLAPSDVWLQKEV